VKIESLGLEILWKSETS